MSGFDSLSDDDVERLVRIIDSVEASAFDYLELEVGDLKVTLGKGDAPVPSVRTAAAPVAPVAPLAPAAPAAAPVPAATAPPAAAAAVEASPAAATDSGVIEIVSPIMGLYYAQSEPGAPPFVTVGASIEADTTIALVEVMKTFNAVPAGVAGVVVEVCVENHQMVEYGQVLLRVRPE